MKGVHHDLEPLVFRQCYMANFKQTAITVIDLASSPLTPFAAVVVTMAMTRPRDMMHCWARITFTPECDLELDCLFVPYGL